MTARGRALVRALGLGPMLLGLACGSPSPRAATGDASAAVPNITPGYVIVGPAGATAYDAPPLQPVGAQGTHLGRGFGFMVAA